MQICALCGVQITAANDSKEHIIPNSIGGVLKTTGFICNTCNSNTGEDWDAELAAQLNPLSLFFGIIRDRGTAPSQAFKTTAGEHLTLHADGKLSPAKPEFKEKEIDTGTRITLTARSMKEAKQMLAGVKRKYPQVDVEGLLANATKVSTYPEGMLHFELSFGGKKAGRSVVKTALAFAHCSGIGADCSNLAKEYLCNEEAEPCFGYYYESDLVCNRPVGVPFHCVSISGNPETGLLLGYVEYFGCQRVIVGLSDDYYKNAVSQTYAINPVSGELMDITVKIDLSKNDLLKIYNYEQSPYGEVEKAFSAVIATGQQKRSDAERERVIAHAVEHAFSNCGAAEGEIITEEHVEKITKLLAEKLTPFVLHSMKRPKRKPHNA
jgi:hypothetical protein